MLVASYIQWHKCHFVTDHLMLIVAHLHVLSVGRLLPSPIYY